MAQLDPRTTRPGGADGQRRRLGGSFLVSCLLHLLALVAFERSPRETEPLAYLPVRFSAAGPAAARFHPGYSRPLLVVQMQRLLPLSVPEELPPVAADWFGAPAPIALQDTIMTLTGFDVLAQKTWQPERTQDVLALLDQAQLRGLRLRALLRASYAMLRTPNGSACDTENQNRRQAELVVDRSLKAMGGLRALSAIMDRKVQVTTWNSRTDVWDVVSEADDFGEALPQLGFLLQLKSDRIRLSYMDRRRPFPRLDLAYAVYVEDLVQGTYRTAFFSTRTHLLVAVVDGETRVEIPQYRPLDGVEVPYVVWTYWRRFAALTRYEPLEKSIDRNIDHLRAARSWR